MKKLDLAAAILILVGAINWGTVGLFNINLIDLLFERAWVDRFVYAMIGFAAFYKIIYWRAIKKRWED